MKTNEEKLNISLTRLLILQEVTMAIIDTEIDNPVLKQILKKDFKRFRLEGKRLNESYRKFIRQDTRFDDPEELFDSECDFMYDVITGLENIKTDESRVKLLSTIKMLGKK